MQRATTKLLLFVKMEQQSAVSHASNVTLFFYFQFDTGQTSFRSDVAFEEKGWDMLQPGTEW